MSAIRRVPESWWFRTGKTGLIYQVEGKAVQSTDDAGIRSELLRILEPVSGEISISRYEVVRDGSGHILLYKVWARR